MLGATARLEHGNRKLRLIRPLSASSLVGEVPLSGDRPGLTNLRTIQDRVLQRRLLTVSGVVQVNTWGGTTKEYEVDLDNVVVPALQTLVLEWTEWRRDTAAQAGELAGT